MKIKSPSFLLIVILNIVTRNQPDRFTVRDPEDHTYRDIPFIQEYHEAFMVSNNQADNEVRSIAVDRGSNVWIATGHKVNIQQSIDFLKDTPLDLVDWSIDHTLREDVHIVRKPILEEVQIEELPSASERSTMRWDKNPWAAVNGNAQQVREPIIWLWPYWMARYLKVIQPQRQN